MIFQMSNDFLHYPAAPVATKMAVSAGIGMLAGIERKWLRKEAGIRTFAVVALMGTLSSLIGTGFIIMAMIGVCPW